LTGYLLRAPKALPSLSANGGDVTLQHAVTKALVRRRTLHAGR
jgi:hypothetical protein